MMKKLLYRGHRVGSLINTNLGVYRIAAHGQSYDALQGGRGIVEMTLERILVPRQALTVGELQKLDASLKSQGALVLVNR